MQPLLITSHMCCCWAHNVCSPSHLEALMHWLDYGCCSSVVLLLLP